MSISWIVFGGFALLSWLISMQFKRKFKMFSEIPVNDGLTGKDVAVKMLADSGIYDVKVQSVKGVLTDHYNPMNRTVNLSSEVYHRSNAAAAAVAAHESGHTARAERKRHDRRRGDGRDRERRRHIRGRV